MAWKKSSAADDGSEPAYSTVLEGFHHDESLQSPGAFLENLVEPPRHEMFEQDYVESKVDFELCRRQYTWRSVP